MDNIENTSVKVNNTKIRSRKSKEEFNEKECEVINYNKQSKILDIRYDHYGIRIKNVEKFNGTDMVTIKYTGEIGKPNFKIEW